MKIAQEAVSVLPNAAGEINVFLAGLRITLTTDEALLLAAALATSLELLQGAPQHEAAAEPWGVGRSTAAPPDPLSGSTGKDATSESDTVLRTRALIQASMRSKGLSLREAHRE